MTKFKIVVGMLRVTLTALVLVLLFPIVIPAILLTKTVYKFADWGMAECDDLIKAINDLE